MDENGNLAERDTKTHQQRRTVLDAETLIVLAEHKHRCEIRAKELGTELPADAFVFSPAPDGSTFPLPDSVTQRYGRLAERLGIDSHLHTLRHYSATELIAAGVDIRTVAGRLGHGGGGATTLRVYAAWLSEADQRAAAALSGRMPARPAVESGLAAVPANARPEPAADRAPVIRSSRTRRPPAPKTAKATAHERWKAAKAAGETLTGAELARAAGVDPSVGRRWRREWPSEQVE